jgi:hypothetical protein
VAYGIIHRRIAGGVCVESGKYIEIALSRKHSTRVVKNRCFWSAKRLISTNGF